MRCRVLGPKLLYNFIIFNYLSPDPGDKIGYKFLTKSGSLVAVLSHGSKGNGITGKLCILLEL